MDLNTWHMDSLEHPRFLSSLILHDSPAVSTTSRVLNRCQKRLFPIKMTHSLSWSWDAPPAETSGRIPFQLISDGPLRSIMYKNFSDFPHLAKCPKITEESHSNGWTLHAKTPVCHIFFPLDSDQVVMRGAESGGERTVSKVMSSGLQ